MEIRYSISAMLFILLVPVAVADTAGYVPPSAAIGPDQEITSG